RQLYSFPTRRSSDLVNGAEEHSGRRHARASACIPLPGIVLAPPAPLVHEASRVGIRWLEGKQMGDRSRRYRVGISGSYGGFNLRSEEHTSELQSREN